MSEFPQTPAALAWRMALSIAYAEGRRLDAPALGDRPLDREYALKLLEEVAQRVSVLTPR